MQRALLTAVRWTWASPWTLLGLCIGSIALVGGGAVQRQRGIIEFHGPAIAWMLSWPRREMHFSAMTLGHVVVGRTAEALEAARPHELVHVRQYERWGPAFVPLYLLCSAYVWCRGGRPYRDNPFEREAYDVAP